MDIENFHNLFAGVTDGSQDGARPLAPGGITSVLARLTAATTNQGDIWIGGAPNQVLAGGQLRGGEPSAADRKGTPLGPGEMIDWPVVLSALYLDFENDTDLVSWTAFNVNSEQ